MVDLCAVNAWLLYRRDRKSFDVPQNRQKDLLAFRVSIADALCKHIKILLSVLSGQPSKKQRQDTLGGAQTSIVCDMFFEPVFVVRYVISERAQPDKYVISVERVRYCT